MSLWNSEKQVRIKPDVAIIFQPKYNSVHFYLPLKAYNIIKLQLHDSNKIEHFKIHISSSSFSNKRTFLTSALSY